MSEKKYPLQGQTIVFTGSDLPHEAVEAVEANGGQALYLPLIETSIRQSEMPDFGQYDWLIFTSRTSAEAFGQLAITTTAKIAAVGEKSAEVLSGHGYSVDFMPSVYSADIFVEQFPAVAGNSRCLFVKGSLARSTIASMPMMVDEWEIYETTLKTDNAKALGQMKDCIAIFASPSAVKAYREAGGDWAGLHIAAIGHVTEQAIIARGGHVDWMPENYTYVDVINEIAKGSCLND